MRRTLAATLAALLLLPAAASAQQMRIGQAPRVPFPVAAIYHQPCPDIGGPCSDPDEGVIYLPRWSTRWDRLHELGHIYLDRLSGFWQGTIIDHLGYNPATTAWLTGSGDDCRPWGPAICPNEMAADAYAACALGLRPGSRMVGHGRRRHLVSDWRTGNNYYPTRRQHRAICRAIRRSATD